MSGLGHILEASGITTIVLGLVPQHVKNVRPPRALLVPFDLGRPLGAPGDGDLQHTVLAAAWDLLDREGPGPVIETLEVAVPDAASVEPWVCPVSFPDPDGEAIPGDRMGDRLCEEVRLLMPWFDQAVRARGHSAADVSGLPVERICRWLCEFLVEPPSDSPVSDRTLAETFKLAAEDLKAFYLEAATARPNTASAQELNNWFWDDTLAGELLRQLRAGLSEHPDPGVRLHAAFTLVPEAQVGRQEAQAAADVSN